jgi:hypothetical protein
MDFTGILSHAGPIGLFFGYIALAYFGTMPEPSQRPIDYYKWTYDAVHVALNRKPPTSPNP